MTMKLTKIGTGCDKTSKNGNQYFSLVIDPEVFKNVYPEDYKKICMFPNQYRRSINDPPYVIMVPAKETQSPKI